MANSTLFYNAHLVTLDCDEGYGTIEHGSMVVESGRIAWLGALAQCPTQYEHSERINCHSKVITPCLIDSHTHCVYAGQRSEEFELRLTGVSYEQIAKRGGGIRSTVQATRKASDGDLLEQSLPRVQHLIDEGVGVIEIKSGYGLDLETELKMLRVAKMIADILPIQIRTTFLGAHALPVEFDDKQAYIDHVCNDMIPAVVDSGLADFVDVFCESIGFSLNQTEQVLKAAQKYHLGIKIHAEQINNLGGASLAAQYGALSVDHLEYLDEAGVSSLANSQTVATLLPGAYYFLKEKQQPPIDLLRQHNIPMAIATDCNPGSSPTTSLLLMMNMACTLFGLTPIEAIRATTINAAKALGMHDQYGTLSAGKQADFILWDIDHPAELSYRLANNPNFKRYRHGELL